MEIEKIKNKSTKKKHHLVAKETKRFYRKQCKQNMHRNTEQKTVMHSTK